MKGLPVRESDRFESQESLPADSPYESLCFRPCGCVAYERPAVRRYGRHTARER